jgi:ribonuclease P protein component
MGAFTFEKHERIKKRKDFLRTYEDGTRINSKHFIVILSRNQGGYRRLGITVTRKTGNAVTRNRTKRLLREFFRLNKKTLPDSLDIVIIVKKGIPFLTYKNIYEELETLFAGSHHITE